MTKSDKFAVADSRADERSSNTVAMAAVVNGEVPRPSSADFSASPPGKRKRSTTPDAQNVEGNNKSHPGGEDRKEGFQESLGDLFKILSK